MLFMAQRVVPKAIPPSNPDSNSDWTFTPYNAVAYDYTGYQLTRPYQHVRQTYNPACKFPACTDPWYVEVVNPQPYGGFNLTYQLRVTCQSASDAQGCPSPALAETAPHVPLGQCSDKGQCTAFDSVCTDASFAQGECTFCDCETGWGDVGCNVAVPDLPVDHEQQVSTQSGLWSYFNVALDVSHTCFL